MKKLFLLLAFSGCIAFSTNAQKACCASKSGAKVCTKTASANAETAAKFASMNDMIETKVCSTSGTISYVKNYVCPESGKVTSTPVEFDASTQKFVNISPQNAEQGVGGQNTKAVKAVKAVKTSRTVKTTAKKACCSSKAGKASCSKEAKVEN
jgi:hypothetical protein